MIRVRQSSFMLRRQTSSSCQTCKLSTTPFARPIHRTRSPSTSSTHIWNEQITTRYAPPGPLGAQWSRSLHSSSPRPAVKAFKLPDIGEGIVEVEMLKWKVQVGQRVEHFDEICEVQSDKSTAEISAPYDGVIHSIGFQEGQMVQVGQTLCEIATEEEEHHEDSHFDHQPPAESSGAPRAEVERTQELPVQRETNSEVLERSDGIFDTETEMERRTEDIFETPEDDIRTQGAKFSGEASILPSGSSVPVQHVYEGEVPERRAEERISDRKIILSSPAVRALARRLDVDLEYVRGSGEKGRVRREDVEAYARNRDTAGSTGSSSSRPPATARIATPRDQDSDVTRVEFGRTRKVMWRALGAQGSVPHFGYSHTLDLTPLLPYIKALNPPSSAPSKQPYMASDIPPSLSHDPSLTPSQKTTLLSFLVKGMLLAMEEHPVMRSRAMSKDDQRWLEIRRDPVIGVAVSDPKAGLVTPSLPSLTPTTSLSQITSHLSTLRAKPTAPGPGPNVIISSVGGLGESTGAMPVLPPNGAVAICAVGRARWDVEWNLRDGGMKLEREAVEKAGTRAVLRCPVGWSGDHRVLEGAELIAFTESWKKWIEEPWRWLKVD